MKSFVKKFCHTNIPLSMSETEIIFSSIKTNQELNLMQQNGQNYINNTWKNHHMDHSVDK
jgi:hypothetical protein